jgi:hypothetical protein
MNTRGATVILVYNGGVAQCYIFVSKPRLHLFMLTYNGYMNRNNVHDSIRRIMNFENICYDSEVKLFPPRLLSKTFIFLLCGPTYQEL